MLRFSTMIQSALTARGKRRQGRHVAGATGEWDVGAAPCVTVIVPVRNGERTIARCLTGLLRQEYPAERFDIVVVDDNSMDRTPEIVCGFVIFDERVKFMPAGMPPAGWSGRAHACWQGALMAEGEWLCFVEAEAEIPPGWLRAAFQRMESKRNGLQAVHDSGLRASYPPWWRRCRFWAKRDGESVLIRRRAYRGRVPKRGHVTGRRGLVTGECYG